MSAAQAASTLGGPLAEAVASSRVLVVGTGGIGCELLKNLVLTGFQNVVAVSLPMYKLYAVTDDTAK